MKRSILSVCVLTLLCLLSCDINALNELLDKAREKFLEENKKLEDLNSREENQESKELQESQEEQADIVVRIEEGVEINKNLQREGIELSLKEERLEEVIEQQFVSQSNALTKEQENELYSQEIKANDIRSKVNSKLATIEAMYREVSASVLKLESIKTDIMKANSDLDRARSSSRDGIDQNVKIKLDQAIKNVRSSSNIAMILYKDVVNGLEHARSSVEHARGLTESALDELRYLRSSNYYYVIRYYYLSDAKTSLNRAENMFAKVESEMGNLRNAMKQAEEDFVALKSAHQALGLK
ncbi:hypothetical protein A7978_05255 (plasmid) [Borrelia turicatae]|uniref:Cytosolic protein n=1 Tax=Borrelia turicatae TaxID=142 RepID=A0A172XDN1_BORTU|nr:hypothetical protein [Borrelia turicatae]ANF34523.1 hypothetical protein A7978_05980 [Borrelia turicatae]ANF34652.1 hypothetical protein A7978_05255 [Borrelia turicatae]UPA15604.1 hypothetical protein btBTE5EL_001297 [Borrelia turicatae]